jgi:Ca2+-binding EF-hand superfamily protein
MGALGENNEFTNILNNLLSGDKNKQLKLFNDIDNDNSGKISNAELYLYIIIHMPGIGQYGQLKMSSIIGRCFRR